MVLPRKQQFNTEQFLVYLLLFIMYDVYTCGHMSAYLFVGIYDENMCVLCVHHVV